MFLALSKASLTHYSESLFRRLIHGGYSRGLSIRTSTQEDRTGIQYVQLIADRAMAFYSRTMRVNSLENLGNILNLWENEASLSGLLAEYLAEVSKRKLSNTK